MNALNKWLLLTVCGFGLATGTGLVKGQGSPARDDLHDLTPIYQELLNDQREALSVTNDEQWKVILPKLEKVDRLKLEAHALEMQSPFGSIFRIGGGGSVGTSTFRKILLRDGALPEVPHEAEDALKKALAGQAPAAEIDAAVARVQAARQQRLAELAKAQSDLRAILTQPQIAAMVAYGILD